MTAKRSPRKRGPRTWTTDDGRIVAHNPATKPSPPAPWQRAAELSKSLARIDSPRCQAWAAKLRAASQPGGMHRAKDLLRDPALLAATADASRETRAKLRALIRAGAKPTFQASTDARRTWWPLHTRPLEHNGEMRAAMDGKSGVYAFRDARTRRVLYVGESHTGRAWSTMLRHTHARKSFDAVGEWTADKPDRLQVAFMPTTPAAALLEESNWIRELKPEANVKGYSDRFIEDEPAPF